MNQKTILKKSDKIRIFLNSPFILILSILLSIGISWGSDEASGTGPANLCFGRRPDSPALSFLLYFPLSYRYV